MADGSKRCSVEGCERGGKVVRGWCATHYLRWRVTGDPGDASPARRKRARCSIDGCDDPVVGHGWCQKHYTRWRRHGDPLSGAPPRPKPPEHCIVDGCDLKPRQRAMCRRHYAQWYRKHRDDPVVVWLQRRKGEPPPPCSVNGCDLPGSVRGLCDMHYSRWLKTGETGEAAPLKRANGTGRGICRVEGCESRASGRGLCGMHYQRFVKDGEPGSVEPKRRRVGTGGYDKNGYRNFTRNGKRVQEHRMVMEQVLGRPLRMHEHVHHKNGIRDDNRPENLELWVKRHPFGQRPEDIAEWVVAQYPELVEAALASRTQLRFVTE